MEKGHSNREREVFGVLYGMEKFHYFCFARWISIITDQKPLVEIFKEDIATLLQKPQYILLRIHQYRIRTLYKRGPDLFIADWLSLQNHEENSNTQHEDKH